MEWPNEFNRAGYKYARFLVIEGQETSTQNDSDDSVGDAASDIR